MTRQRGDIDAAGLPCRPLVLVEEKQLLGHRGLPVRNDVVHDTAGPAGGAQLNLLRS
jgi:hypothetical protein